MNIGIQKKRERWLKILEENFIDNSGWSRQNCTIEEFKKICWNGGVYRKEPNEEVIKEFMEYKKIEDIEIVNQYFNNQCETCGKIIRNSSVVAMNLKLLGRKTKRLYCKKCLRSFLNISNKEYNKMKDEFKSSGCALF